MSVQRSGRIEVCVIDQTVEGIMNEKNIWIYGLAAYRGGCVRRGSISEGCYDAETDAGWNPDSGIFPGSRECRGMYRKEVLFYGIGG